MRLVFFLALLLAITCEIQSERRYYPKQRIRVRPRCNKLPNELMQCSYNLYRGVHQYDPESEVVMNILRFCTVSNGLDDADFKCFSYDKFKPFLDCCHELNAHYVKPVPLKLELNAYLECVEAIS
ncbi:uncharacterized protein LOC135387491 [Ornithodoros turicata]|uniref:uncharacterized protein LOC135387491 n=1 Tax=Ornithodoros turicata TaxID=34597 RepID=UPI00313958D1